MVDYLELKYLNLLSPRLRNFKQKNNNLWNFACPICHDSHKDKLKSRGYLFEKKSNLIFYCHNCNASTGFITLLKQLDPSLYKDYLLEKYSKKDLVDTSAFICRPTFSDSKPRSINLPSVLRLPEEHFCKVYVKNRLIPKKFWDQLFFAEDFNEFIKEINPDKTSLYREPRLIIPFYNKEGVLQGVQGRALNDSKIKYITLKIDEENEKLFGAERVDLSKTVYVTEGPIDSLFLDNAVATMDADLLRAIPILGLDTKYVFVYDNESRNPQIIKNIRKTISRGFSVVIWPSDCYYKDINEFILSGTSSAAVQHLIDSNTVEGLEATLKLNMWSKI